MLRPESYYYNDFRKSDAASADKRVKKGYLNEILDLDLLFA